MRGQAYTTERNSEARKKIITRLKTTDDRNETQPICEDRLLQLNNNDLDLYLKTNFISKQTPCTLELGYK